MKRLFPLIVAALVVIMTAVLTTPTYSAEAAESQRSAAEVDELAQEEDENAKIEAALLERANKIENCTVTWYTASVEECGKDDGITYSGLPVVEHLTCAVDKNVIPLYADVFVQYADGTIEQLWATDTGVSGNAVDIYTPDYDYAIQCGRQSLTVWYMPPVEVETN